MLQFQKNTWNNIKLKYRKSVIEKSLLRRIFHPIKVSNDIKSKFIKANNSLDKITITILILISETFHSTSSGASDVQMLLNCEIMMMRWNKKEATYKSERRKSADEVESSCEIT